MPGASRILVVKLGALGDFVQATGPFAAIRRHHAGDSITLLTGAPYAELARASPWFDRVWIDSRPGWSDPAGWLALRRRLRGGGFARVYDLQTSDRSSFYFRLFWPGRKPEWSGIARGCSHPHANPGRDSMHTLERQAEQLAMAGIEPTPPPDLAWVRADGSGFALDRRYGLLLPGGAPHRPAKRWPAERYGELARWLADRGVEPVVLGTRDEGPLAAEVTRLCPATRDLTGRTDLFHLVALGRGAVLAVGNDTGPMHLFAVAGCPSVVLYSHDSAPALCGQRGPKVTILRRPRACEISLAEVTRALAPC